MKHINIFFVVLSLVMLILVGCSNSSNITGPEKNAAEISSLNETAASIKMVNNQKSMSFPIWTDKDINVGTVHVSNDKNFIYVTYEVIKGWTLQESNLHVADDIRGIPITRDGTPSPKQFAYRMMHKANLSSYTFQVPQANYGFGIGQEIVIAAHAVIISENYPFGKGDLLEVWAGNKIVHDKNPWYVIYYTLKESGNNGGGFKQENIFVDRIDDNPILN